MTPATPLSAGVARTLARHPRPLGGDTARHVGPPAMSLSGMVLNNRQAESHQLAIPRKPDWIRAKAPGGEGYLRLKGIIDEHRLHTVCQEANCPNIGECWSRGTATIMILGDVCTRACGFCNIKTGRPPTLDLDEPRRVAESLKLLNLKHVVITSVNRDELADGGAAVWAETIERVHEACPNMSVEVLVGDFQGDERAIQRVIDARPEILAHNLETVRRMHPAVRPQADYQRSLNVLRQIKANGLVTKTGIMVGIGERDDEVLALMDDVISLAPGSAGGSSAKGGGHCYSSSAVVEEVDGCIPPSPLGRGVGGEGSSPGSRLLDSGSTFRGGADILTIGQYLQPTRNHLPIDRWVPPPQFDVFRQEGLARGFKVVESGPLVRSSYHAEEQAERLSPDRRETVEMMDRLIAGARHVRA